MSNPPHNYIQEPPRRPPIGLKEIARATKANEFREQLKRDLDEVGQHPFLALERGAPPNQATKARELGKQVLGENIRRFGPGPARSGGIHRHGGDDIARRS